MLGFPRRKTVSFCYLWRVLLCFIQRTALRTDTHTACRRSMIWWYHLRRVAAEFNVSREIAHGVKGLVSYLYEWQNRRQNTRYQQRLHGVLQCLSCFGDRRRKKNHMRIYASTSSAAKQQCGHSNANAERYGGYSLTKHCDDDTADDNHATEGSAYLISVIMCICSRKIRTLTKPHLSLSSNWLHCWKTTIGCVGTERILRQYGSESTTKRLAQKRADNVRQELMRYCIAIAVSWHRKWSLHVEPLRA